MLVSVPASTRSPPCLIPPKLNSGAGRASISSGPGAVRCTTSGTVMVPPLVAIVTSLVASPCAASFVVSMERGSAIDVAAVVDAAVTALGSAVIAGELNAREVSVTGEGEVTLRVPPAVPDAEMAGAEGTNDVVAVSEEAGSFPTPITPVAVATYTDLPTTSGWANFAPAGIGQLASSTR